jgi:hypothetical protein
MRRRSWPGLIVASLAVGLVITAAGLAISMFRPGALGQGGSPQPQASNSAPQEIGQEPLPVPEGDSILAVLDPEVVKPKVSAEEAVALARASMGNMVGSSPRVQLVHMTGRDSDWPQDGFTGWIILSTDVVGQPHYPYDPKTDPPIVATYTWVLVRSDGEVWLAVQNMFDAPERVPPLPEG